jgi:hypothetical protein
MRLAALGAAVALAGCGLVPETPPDWVVNRQPLPLCGEEGEDGRAFDIPVRSCLLDAFRDGASAEMISTETTMEGDPITRIIRVHENGVVEMFVDWTRDHFSSKSWEREVCEELVSVDEANANYEFDVYNEDEVFIGEGCREEPMP